MKKITSLIVFTILLLFLFTAIYPAVIWGIAQMAPNNGKGETVAVNGKVVGYQKIGQAFNKPEYFWGRPSAVDYNAAGSCGSNKGPSNKEYLDLVQKRVDTFLTAHPYLKKSDIPADMVTASGSGLDPHISPQGALIQVQRVAATRHLPQEKVKALVESKINIPSVAGTATVNILELNVALNELK